MATAAKGMDSKARPAQGRGRPRLTAAERAQAREPVLEAAARLYGRTPYSELTVAMLLAEAGWTRPRFYRWFSGLDEVLDAVVLRAQAALLKKVVTASLGEGKGILERAEQAIDAYLSWIDDTGPVLLALHREANLPNTPVYRGRQRLLKALRDHLTRLAAASGFPDVPLLFFESVIAAVEHVGAAYTVQRMAGQGDVATARAVAMRIVLAALAGPEDQSRVPPLPGTLSEWTSNTASGSTPTP